LSNPGCRVKEYAPFSGWLSNWETADVAGKAKVKKKPAGKAKALAKPAAKNTAKTTAKNAAKPAGTAVKAPPADPRSNGGATSAASKDMMKTKSIPDSRREALHHMLMAKRQEILKEIGSSLGQSLTEDQQRRLESAMDIGDQALMDLERELGISLMEMRNRKRQMIDEALTRLADGTYGICADCGVEISEKRLAAVPFAKLCVECQSQEELLEKIEKGEDRD
jgi:DnaK suppressor protein